MILDIFHTQTHIYDSSIFSEEEIIYLVLGSVPLVINTKGIFSLQLFYTPHVSISI